MMCGCSQYHGRQFAYESEAGGRPLTRSQMQEKWLPCLDHLRNAIKRARGAPGIDGWTSSELKLLARMSDEIISELHELLCDTTRRWTIGGANSQALEAIASWRVTGIPKKQPDQFRPISVASVILRALLTACEGALLAPEGRQYASRSGTSCVHATADWLKDGTLQSRIGRRNYG